MTFAGAIVTAVTLPVLLGQLLYATTRGKPGRDHEGSESTSDGESRQGRSTS